MNELATGAPTVFIGQDDGSVRGFIQSLLKSVGLSSECFAAPDEFLRSKRPDGPSCLVLDVRLPGMSGLDFQHKLTEAGVHIPVIFITGQGGIPMTRKAMKSRTVEVLSRPVSAHERLPADQRAIAPAPATPRTPSEPPRLHPSP